MRFRKLAMVAVLPMIIIGLSACNGTPAADDGVDTATGNEPAATASASPTVDAQDAQLKYAQCMRENGVDVPDPEPGEPIRITGDGNKANYDKMQKAQKECQPILQEGGVLPNGNDPERADAMVKFAECMREHGVDVPDPKPGEGVRIQGGQAGDEAKVEAAQKACRDLLPGGGPGAGQ